MAVVAFSCGVVDSARCYAEYADAKIYNNSLLQCSGSTLASVDSGPKRVGSVSSSICSPTPEVSKVALFNSSLHSFAHLNIYLISLPDQLIQLLDLYYKDNKLASSEQMFPYLHGMNSMKQRVYFNDHFDPDTDFDILHGDPGTLKDRFPYNTDVKVPDQSFHLMSVNSLDSEKPRLVNSISMDDLLTFKSSYTYSTPSSDVDHFDYTIFEKFDHINQLHGISGHSQDLMNRNYDLQIKLMAPLSHFLVYNSSMNFFANSEAAKAISNLMALCDRFVYVVDFDVSKWSQLGSYLESNTSYSICDQLYPSDLSAQPHQCKLSNLEQNLIWLLNGLKELFPRLYIGNVYNFKQLVSSKQRKSHYDFKLHVYGHEKAKLPSMSSLNRVFERLQLSDSLDEPLFIEFPDSIFKHSQSLSYPETLSYLNVLKLINDVVNRFKKNVLVYCIDGFTGISLLSFSLGLFWGSDNLEDVAHRILRKSTFKFYFLKGDFGFLKTFEVYIQWFKRQPLKAFDLLIELPLDSINDAYRPFTKEIDWFDPKKDVNFPAHIFESLFLGSVAHASSSTVLSTVRVNKIISIDEKPSWYKHLKSVFEHEATSSTQVPVLKPAYVFNNGTSMVYDIPLSAFRSNAPIPDVKSIVFICNLRDDGKDSMLPLLVNCPEHIQRKILIDPSDSNMRALVHCRIGVSRSASLVIASVMKHFGMDLLESYMYVRVRRYNVIIQPNLRIFYELFLFDEALRRTRYGEDSKPKHCWWVICEQIFRLNQQYMK